jgi:hypothetical protein
MIFRRKSIEPLRLKRDSLSARPGFQAWKFPHVLTVNSSFNITRKFKGHNPFSREKGYFPNFPDRVPGMPFSAWAELI